MPSTLEPAALADISAECVCFHLRKTARTITQAYDHALAPTGLRATQFTLLRVVSRTGGLPFAALADVLGMERTTLTRNLKVLERDKLVRTVPGADRRVRLVSLTPKGQRKLADAEPIWAAAHADITGRLGEDTWAELRRNLSRTITVGLAAGAAHA
ncbi:MAG TPA: MarR family winged helix-turn-helix transcriptional regulator [Gemmatimonadales bacterium]|jgi:DNA-binding MarR family transcriptional regulator|nr:MarR family winged helix-turn-helix transcriptional regulator [Gemmatimonadales bacterium]